MEGGGNRGQRVCDRAPPHALCSMSGMTSSSAPTPCTSSSHRAPRRRPGCIHPAPTTSQTPPRLPRRRCELAFLARRDWPTHTTPDGDWAPWPVAFPLILGRISDPEATSSLRICTELGLGAVWEERNVSRTFKAAWLRREAIVGGETEGRESSSRGVRGVHRVQVAAHPTRVARLLELLTPCQLARPRRVSIQSAEREREEKERARLPRGAGSLPERSFPGLLLPARPWAESGFPWGQPRSTRLGGTQRE